MKKRAILIAAGEATRWGNYLDTPKHFIEVDGEPIIKRSVRLLKKFGVDDIYIVAKDDTYQIEGAKLYIPTFNLANHDADKFLNSKDLWLRDEGKTIVLYGDVYFTEYAMETIVNHPHNDWLLFARQYESTITGGAGECFAQTFYPGQVEEHERALLKLVEYFDTGRLNRIGGWEHYRIMAGLPEPIIHKHFTGDRFVEINDWTDDFDNPTEYETFLIKRKMLRNGKCPLCERSQ